VTVKEFGFGYRPRLLKLGRSKETVFTLNWLPLGSFVKMADEKNAGAPGSFADQSRRTRLAILAVGPILNLTTLAIFFAPATFFFTLAYVSGAPIPFIGINVQGEEAPLARTVISDVKEGTPASESGLKPGDVILGADNVEFKTAGDSITYAEDHAGAEITLHIKRGDQQIKVPIIPRAHPPVNQGPLGITITYEGIEYQTTRYRLHSAIAEGMASTAQQVRFALYLPIGVLQHTIPADEVRPATPAEVGQFVRSGPGEATAQNRWFRSLLIMGTLSTWLVVPIVLVTAISVLPIPRWDTWRILRVVFGR
jgi:regulator of sigma E protease